jgi:hypothetical protein
LSSFSQLVGVFKIVSGVAENATVAPTPSPVKNPTATSKGTKIGFGVNGIWSGTLIGGLVTLIVVIVIQ